MKTNTDKESILDHKTLLSILSYNELTGWFSFNYIVGSRKKGSRAGSILSKGYRHIRINKQAYYEHRLAWFYVHKEWPPNYIDHIDQDKSNNILSNLRCVTKEENQRKLSLRKTNTSGFAGVCKVGNRWQAQISIMSKFKYLGLFNTPEEASEAYETYKNKL